MGHFTSRDGKVVIEHDIGYLAGEHLGMGGSETLIQGARVRYGRVNHSRWQGGRLFFR